MDGRTRPDNLRQRSRARRLGWLLPALLGAGCVWVPLAAADYPRIVELSSRDVLYRQLQEDLQSYFRAVSRLGVPSGAGRAGAGTARQASVSAAREGSEMPPLRLFSYRIDGTLDLFALAARLNLPYDCLATLNGLSTPAALMERSVLLVPNLPGLFVRQQPSSSFEEILHSVSQSQRKASQTVRVIGEGGVQVFWFYPGESFTPVERAYYLNILFRFPLPFARLSSRYGARDNPLTGHEEFHQGIDLASPEGTEVYAARDGVVLFAGTDPLLGNLVIVEHEAGYQTVYGHLRSIAVRMDQQLRSGTIIGEVGTTGRSTGPHLHFEVRRGGAARDPAPLLPLPKDDSP